MPARRDILLFVLLFVISLPAVTARLYSSDEVEYFSYLRSLWFDHDVSFENEYRYFYDHGIAQTPDFHQTFLELETATGRRINYGTIGCAILWAPFYAVADMIARVIRAAGGTVAVDGYSKPYLAAVAYGSAFYGFAAVVLGIAAARRLIGTHALSSGLAVWLGTPLLFYMYVAPPFSHACSAFAVALFVTVWLNARQSWTVSGAVLLGLTGALMAMVREQDLLIALGPVVDFLLAWAKGTGKLQELRHTAAVAAAGALAFLVGYLPQLIAYQALNGAPRPSPLVMRKMFWHAPHALQVLADPEHGWLFWTPLALLALIGLVQFAVRPMAIGGENANTPTDLRQIGLCLLLMVALQVYVSGAVESWTVAGAFGQRRFVAMTVFLIMGLAALQSRTTSRGTRIVMSTLIAIAVWWNVALTAEFGTGMMNRQKLELGRNAYDAFVTLPRTAPELVYRYFTNRSSFYKPAETTR